MSAMMIALLVVCGLFALLLACSLAAAAGRPLPTFMDLKEDSSPEDGESSP
jgi:hypothetical protein